MTLSKLTEVALKIDSNNRNLNDGDLIQANKRYHVTPSNTASSTDQWSYKEAKTAIMTAKALTEKKKDLLEGATTFTYSQHPETLSGNDWFGGQEIRKIHYKSLADQRKMSFYEVIGHIHQNRAFDARDLILANKSWIANAPSVTDNSSPVFSYSECSRDIEFFLEAIAYNLSNGGNNRVYDYAFISRKALSDQASKEGRTLEAIADDYVIAFNGTNNGTVTDEGVRNRLEAIINGSADPDGNGTSILEESGVTPAFDNCIDIILVSHTFLDLILDIIRKGNNSVAYRSNPYGNQDIGMGRLHDAKKLITDEDSLVYDDGNGNLGIKGWISTPPSISDTVKFDPVRCPRDLGFFLDAIAYDLVRGGNYMTHNYAQQSRNALQDQANKSGESRTYEEIVKDYYLAINGSSDGSEGFRYRINQVLQGTAIIGNTPLSISDYDITSASDRCMDVVSSVNVFLDIILLILEKGEQAVPQNPISLAETDSLFFVPDNREGTNIYKRRPYSFDKIQIGKCLRDIGYYLRYITYGLVANDFGIIDELFLNGLVETNKAFNLETSWYKAALDWMGQELSDKATYYFGEESITITMPSDNSKSFTINTEDQLNKALEFIDYIKDRI